MANVVTLVPVVPVLYVGTVVSGNCGICGNFGFCGSCGLCGSCGICDNLGICHSYNRYHQYHIYHIRTFVVVILEYVVSLVYVVSVVTAVLLNHLLADSMIPQLPVSTTVKHGQGFLVLDINVKMAEIYNCRKQAFLSQMGISLAIVNFCIFSCLSSGFCCKYEQ
jgi:hypothetical protein